MSSPYFATVEHDRYRRTIVRTVAATIKEETGKSIPEAVLMIGSDWIYRTTVRYVGAANFTINPVGLWSCSESRNVTQIISDFSLPRQFALIPETDDRMRQARELGDVVDERPFSFRIKKANHDVSVYTIRDARHVINDNDRLPNDGTVGWTET